MTDTPQDSAGAAPNSTLLDSGADQNAQPNRSFLSRLYTGTGAFDVVGRRKFYYLLTGAIVLICLLSMVFRGFTLGIDFEGGTQIQVPASDGITTEQVETVFTDTLGFGPEQVQTVGSGAGATVQVRSEALDAGQTDEVRTALFVELQPVDNTGTATPNAISFSDVSETWGGQITQKALIALVVFLVIVSIYIAIRYERDMALAALAALFFDLLVTAGIYSLVGFEVTPATVIGLLTILGFSLYDSVVVFDKVEENTRGVLHLNRRTYAEQANLAVNQTLMRSINTTVIGILPVLALMVIAVWMLGVGTLKDLALVQLVGIIVGAYSSIFFATPLLVSIKEKWGPVAAHTKKVHGKRAEAAERARSGKLVGAGVRVDTVPAEPAPVTPRVGARPTGKRGKNRR
ncbi:MULTISPECIES: protein translocase subunit SecF [Nocardiaceae]|jgi:preprotein translocase subunit SecF|uniref:protein translocase subunit SecF n=1 Tax=Nocardiaceae TaxID=85025 RepID=UPI001E3E8F4D|nr:MULTISPECIES: protein translocase subunit SecF [Rhodococcus]MCC8928273.1 protein translocase subunit SecF [Rhodococcus sp. I2R]MCZ4277727.1 protein translocase subunit SecF [Rhodococcus yunnanensis]